ncbi:LptF/LptG family permease [Candidatus Sumerlaeota bacterium]|nr:LptF/LptG family permease [Candidatus Sumerlaeota bacterium]
MMIFAKKAQFGIDQSSGEVRLDLLDGSVHLLELSDEQKSVKAPKIKVKPDGIEAAAGGGKKKTKKEEPSGNAASADAEQPAPAQSTAAATVAEGEASKSEDAQTSPALQEKEKKKGRDRDYAIIEFSKLTKVETAGLSEASGSWRTKTVPELLTIMRDEKLESNQRQKAKATLLERYSLALSSLIFAFIGLPLAIWIRPTGKSIGIVVAAGVIFVYHLMVRTGNTMVSADQAFGTIVIFAPNVLFAAIGSGLWWRAIRR